MAKTIPGLFPLDDIDDLPDVVEISGHDKRKQASGSKNRKTDGRQKCVDAIVRPNAPDGRPALPDFWTTEDILWLLGGTSLSTLPSFPPFTISGGGPAALDNQTLHDYLSTGPGSSVPVRRNANNIMDRLAKWDRERKERLSAAREERRARFMDAKTRMEERYGNMLDENTNFDGTTIPEFDAEAYRIKSQMGIGVLDADHATEQIASLRKMYQKRFGTPPRF